MTISKLGFVLPIHPSKIHCVFRPMQILVHSGFFADQKTGQSDEENGYVLTPASRLLLKDNPLSARPFLLTVLDLVWMKPWQYLSAWFQDDSDSPIFSTAHGCTLWDYAAHEPRLNHLFNGAMANNSLLATRVVVTKCRGVFEGLNSLVDVGGGTGTITKLLAKAFPQMFCTIFDLPHVVAGLQESENFKYLEGNMFEKVPPGDAIMLKWILHDWSDEDYIKILKRCKEAIESNKGGKVIIIEMIMENKEVNEEAIQTKLLFDMEMMVISKGQERNEQEWSKLFVDVGFTYYKIHHILGLRSLIESFA